MSLKRQSEDSDQPETKRPKIGNVTHAAGIIQKVRLENFMCHAKLSFEPNPNVNFITGENGAGKSSILQAIGLGLGADSKHTKRYTKMTDFIKRGTAKAVIEITLKNQGEDAFKPEVYGESIIFERTIRDSGQCPLVLKEANGNVKVTKGAREEAKRALDSFRIQVENPVIILQQEEAKQFFKIESPDKLYEFFRKGTMLKQVIYQYKAGFAEIDVIKINVNNLENDVKKSNKLLSEKKEAIKSVQVKDEEWEKVTGEYAWANVKECGEKVLVIKKTLLEKQNLLNNPNEKLEVLRKEAEMLKDFLAEEQIKIDEEMSAYRELDDEIVLLNQQIVGIKKAEKAAIEDLKKCDEATSKIKTEINTLEDHVQTVLGRSAEEKQQLENEKTRKIHLLEKEIEDMERVIDKKSAERLNLDSKEEKLNLSIEALEQQKNDLQLTINSINQEIKEIKNLGKRSLAVYGQKYAMVEEKIQNDLNQFEEKPIGPVGRYVHLKSPAEPNSNLSKLAESILSWSLTSYLCHSDKDRRLLARIVEKVFGSGFKPKIFVSRFLQSRHQVERANVHVTLMDLLEVEVIPVFNFLVDQVSIESVAMCISQDQAKQMTTWRNRVPENLRYAVTPDFYKFMPPSPTSDYRTYSLDQNSQGLLSGSSSEKMEQKRILSDENVVKLNETDQESLSIKKGVSEVEMQKNGVVKKIQDTLKNLSTAKTELKNLKFKPENDTSESLMGEIELKTKEKVVFENRRVVILSRRSAIQSELNSLKNVRDRKITEIGPLKEKWSLVNSKFSQSNAMYVNKCKEVANQEKAMRKLQDEVRNLEGKRGEAIQKHKKATATAEKMTGKEGKVIPSESTNKLNAKLQLLKEQKKNLSEDASILEDMKEDYSKLKEEVKLKNSKLECQKLYLKEVEDIMRERGQLYLMIRRRIVNMVTRKFNHITRDLQKDIGCNIFLRIDIRNKELRFSFASEDESVAKTNVSSLSGGEKSFAQMGLICSLWEHMQPPFRCLDEWDVFLDQVNRNKLKNKLLKFGLSQNDKQFIFLSPQGAIEYKDVPREDRDKVAIIEIKKS